MQEYTDRIFMKRAFDLAQLGQGRVSPNPLVGAVIVHEGRIIGEGYHQVYGGPHAEVNAVNSVTERHLLPQATLYCTLEPCFHFGKTPPCVDLVLQHRFKRVVIADRDINPLVAGQSVAKMRAAGIEVAEGVLREQFAAQNRAFIHWITQKRPYVILKWAQSRDGFLGKTGERTAISGSLTRRLVHRWRTTCDAIMVGTQTALVDNPMLDNRFFPGKTPLRVFFDQKATIPSTHHLLDDSTPTWVIGPERVGTYRHTRFLSDLPPQNNLEAVLTALTEAKMGILLVEGGARLLSSFIQMGLCEEIRVIESPILLGNGVAAPLVPSSVQLQSTYFMGNDAINIYARPLHF